MRTIISIALAIWLPFQGMAQTTDNCSLDFPADVEAPLWLDDFDTCDPNIRRFIEYRLFGLEFYAPALEQLSRLNHAEQLEIIESFRVKSGPYDALKQDLSLPMSLIETILREAEVGGADTDWDIPAFEEVLLELRGDGETKSGNTFSDLRDFAPTSTGQIYFTFAVDKARQDNAEARQDNAALRAARDALREAVSATQGP